MTKEAGEQSSGAPYHLIDGDPEKGIPENKAADHESRKGGVDKDEKQGSTRSYRQKLFERMNKPTKTQKDTSTGKECTDSSCHVVPKDIDVEKGKSKTATEKRSPPRSRNNGRHRSRSPRHKRVFDLPDPEVSLKSIYCPLLRCAVAVSGGLTPLEEATLLSGMGVRNIEDLCVLTTDDLDRVYTNKTESILRRRRLETIVEDVKLHGTEFLTSEPPNAPTMQSILMRRLIRAQEPAPVRATLEIPPIFHILAYLCVAALLLHLSVMVYSAT